ncbi:MAG TPA: hypothetical protein VGB54_08745 [Allosphingosinicella sp.]
MTWAVADRRERLRQRLVIHMRRMFGAMLCWTALQAAAAHVHDGRAEAEPQRASAAAATMIPAGG